MSELRVGLGVDLHRFADEADADDGPLVLGGVRFAGETALVGHSDADAIAHAVADAVLGAAGLGDMGSHFPDTDPAWRGADSLGLLERGGGHGRGARLAVRERRLHARRRASPGRRGPGRDGPAAVRRRRAGRST